MRLHHLEVQAFGPFAGPVEVDLDELAAGGLFLIHGPTGSGKTSLLDAVCFALYAGVPGARRKGSLRSHHAAADVAPRVRLEFTAAGRRLRITRSPEWSRPKKRGSGTTSSPASVSLEELRDDGWALVSGRAGEVDQEVLDVLGMGLEQFSKVVLLPQGEFAGFLRARAEERGDVLQRLFDIEAFADIERWLAAERRASEKAFEAASAALDHTRSRIREELEGTDHLAIVDGPPGSLGTDDGTEGTSEPLTDLPPDQLPARLGRLLRSLEDRVTAALARSEAADHAVTTTQSALEQARLVDAARARGVRARRHLDALDAAEDEVSGLRDELRAADRAAALQGYLTADRRAASDVDAAADALRRAAVVVDELGVALAHRSPAEAADAVHALDDTVTEVARLAREVSETERVRDDLVTEHGEAAAGLAAARGRLAERAGEVEEQTAEVARLSTTAARVEDLRQAVSTAAARLAQRDDADRDAEARDALRPTLLAARTHLADVTDRLADLYRRRLDGMAAELAGDLRADAPCPVCGAVEHPAPAVAIDPVTPDEVALAEEQRNRAHRAERELSTRLEALTAAVETRLLALDGASREHLAGELRAAEEALALAEADALALEAGLRALERAREAHGQLASTVDELGGTVTALAARLADTAERLEQLTTARESAIAAHRGCPCGGGGRPAGHVTAARALDEWSRADEAAREATTRRDEAAEDLAAACHGAGFDDADAARDAQRPDDHREMLRTRLERHDHERASAEAVVADPDVVAALEVEAPDLDALRSAREEARQRARRAQTAHALLARSETSLRGLAPVLDEQVASVLTAQQRHLVVKSLADLAGGAGDNALKMQLTSFVLAARLETVATLANERLRLMGGGRYLLEHSDERVGRGRSGLGLRVLDQWTGTARDTSSLSGGESFMVSLALALGLADAVREEAGGLDLGTLFVDEGFGSLDDDSLEQVMTVLDGLRDGGRCVGVVSHVADLRARIPDQVVLHKGTDGSTVEVRVAAPVEGAPAA